MDKNEALKFYEKFENKLRKTSLEIGVKFPYTTKNGKYEEFTRRGDIGTWTSNFWCGMMWQAYLATNEKQYLDIAQKCTSYLDEIFSNTTRVSHDIGFLTLLSAVADYRITGNEEAKTKGILGAIFLASRFDPKIGAILANDYRPGLIIIDTMMNIQLLFWASEVTGNTRYKEVAIAHADTVMKSHIREDGSVEHQVRFDVETGLISDKPAGQGYAKGSSWSRGQAWALYGFTLCYIHTKDEKYLNTAKKIANYFLAALDDTGVPNIDFRSPDQPDLRDSTAGAISSCGLIELSRNLPEYEGKMYLKGAFKILNGLYGCCNFESNEQSILQMGSEGYHIEKGKVIMVGSTRVVMDGPHIPIIYGDYFLLEALLKFKDGSILFW